MSNLDTATAHLLAIPCCSSGFTHFRRSDGSSTLTCYRSGGYAGCGRTITQHDIPAPTPGDTVTFQNDVLVYAVDPHATFTYRCRSSAYTFTATEVNRYLRDICSWQLLARDPFILEAARTGRAHHESGYGLESTLTRN